jgi:dTDP-4-dehydrorhamnose 3,5-epimerase
MPFLFKATAIEGLLLIEPRCYSDERGFFMESYRESEFREAGIVEAFVQDNHSRSSRGVLRGLHFQSGEKAQGKLIRVIIGRVWDVAVDLRSGSPSYGTWWGSELSGENRQMLYIPPGFAHGFVTLSEEAHLCYKCSAEYDKASDGGVRWDDPELAVAWPTREVTVSAKDSGLPFLKELK